VGALRARDRRRLRGGAALKPVLFVTNHAPAFRVGAFTALHEREHVVFALIGGGVRHGGTIGEEELPFPAVRPRQDQVRRLAASGRYRAVVAGLSGRIALPAAFTGARHAHVPFILWATIWAHPRTAAHALSYLPLRHIYRDADAIATYGPHVSAYVRAKGARGPVFEAPQSVDDAFWTASAQPDRRAPFQVLFAGRVTREKGVRALLDAWRTAGFEAPSTALVLVGDGPIRARAVATGAGVHAEGALDAARLRNFYAGSDVVAVPSIPTRDFREPWGLVVNEAFDQGVPVIATDAVGAAAGGLVQHERTGLVVPAGDADALAAALRRLHDDRALRERLGAAGREAVRAYSHEAWAAGMTAALQAAGASKGGC
jgi:glycosyltransferase involved in cell wall biosynthesis